MKIREILIVIAVLLVELTVIAPFFSTYFLSILPAAILYLTITSKTENAFVAIFSIGFLTDLACLNKSLSATLFVIVEFIVAYFAKQKIIDFRNPASLFLFIVGFTLLKLFIEMFINHGFVDQRQVVFSILANIIISLILSIVVYKLSLIKRLNEI